MHDGNCSNASLRARRLIFLRRAIFPSLLNPTRWKTSLPMSTPITAKDVVLVSRFGFIAASPLHRRPPSKAKAAGEAAGPSHFRTSELRGKPGPRRTLGSGRPVARSGAVDQPRALDPVA